MPIEPAFRLGIDPPDAMSNLEQKSQSPNGLPGHYVVRNTASYRVRLSRHLLRIPALLFLFADYVLLARRLSNVNSGPGPPACLEISPVQRLRKPWRLRLSDLGPAPRRIHRRMVALKH